MPKKSQKPWLDRNYNKPIEFIGYYGCLENSFPVTILVGGIQYPSVEHALQATKVSDVFLKHKISKTDYLPTVLKLLEDVSVRPNWEDVKYATLEQMMRLKFQTSSKCKDVLISTGTRPLLSPKDAMMGKILMKIRNELAGRAN